MGSHVADALIGRGDKVFVLDDLSTGKPENVHAEAELIEADIRTADAAAAIEHASPEAVFHLAAQVSVLESIRNPRHDWEVNVDGSINVLEAAAGAGCRIFVNFSTGIVYGELEDGEFPIAETARKLLPFPYSRSKYEFERRLQRAAAERGISAASVRPGNIYGPRQDPHGEAGVVAIFCERLIIGKPLTMHGEGAAVRDYIFISDVVSAAMKLFDAMQHAGLAADGEDEAAFNAGTGTGTEVVKLADLLEGIAAERGIAAAGRERSPARPGEVSKIILDIAKARRELDWTPSVRVNDGLRETFDWFVGMAGR